MRKKGVARFVCALSAAILCFAGLTACSGGFTGGVAATVNGEEIPEDKVTTYIENFRASYGLTDSTAWKSWLQSTGYTPESLRNTIINMFVQQEAVKLAAVDQGITISPETIDEHVNSIKANYSNDEDWQKALEAVGLTEDEYRESIERSLMEQELSKMFAVDEGSDNQLLDYCSLFLKVFDGAKRSSHILFSSDDAETAKTVLEQINNGSLDFEEAAATYSLDGSGANGGDVGWDKLSSFITEYTDALGELDKGEVSGLVNSQYGIHIIKCTDVFEAPDELTSVDQLPDEMVEYVQNVLDSGSPSAAFSAYISAYAAGLDIVIKDIPTSVPYYVTLPAAGTSTAATSGASSQG